MSHISSTDFCKKPKFQQYYYDPSRCDSNPHMVYLYLYCTLKIFTALDDNERAPDSYVAISQAVNSGGLEYNCDSKSGRTSWDILHGRTITEQ